MNCCPRTSSDISKKLNRRELHIWLLQVGTDALAGNPINARVRGKLKRTNRDLPLSSFSVTLNLQLHLQDVLLGACACV